MAVSHFGPRLFGMRHFGTDISVPETFRYRDISVPGTFRYQGYFGTRDISVQRTHSKIDKANTVNPQIKISDYAPVYTLKFDQKAEYGTIKSLIVRICQQ